MLRVMLSEPMGRSRAPARPERRLRRLVSNPTHSVSGSTVTLGWTASPTPGATYHVYRASTALAHSWTRLTSTPLTTPGFTHTSAPPGTNHYLIRALAVKTTGTGSYTNVSLGIRRTAVVP